MKENPKHQASHSWNFLNTSCIIALGNLFNPQGHAPATACGYFLRSSRVLLLRNKASKSELTADSAATTSPSLHAKRITRENRSILSCHHKRILCNFCRDPSSGNTKHKSAHAFANSISMLWTTNDNSRSTFSKTQPTPSYSPWCLPDIGPLLPKPVRVDAMGGGCDVKWTWGTIKYLYCFTSGTPQPPKSTINWSNSMHGG